MAYCYDNLKLEKGMYHEAGRSFTQVLESRDPSEQYRGTALEGLDAFQRQLKRFDIKVKGTGSDVVEKFFRTADSAVLFPEYIARSVRQGMEEADLLPQLTAAVTRFDGMDYRSITSEAGGEEKELRRVDEGTEIPSTTVKVQENLVKLNKRGRMLVASYEAVRCQKLDLFSVTLRQIGAHISRMHLEDAIQVLMEGDGNGNAAPVDSTATEDTVTYEDLVDFWAKFDPYEMNTLLVGNDVMVKMLKLEEFQNPLTGLNFQGTGRLSTPLGASLLRTSAMPAGTIIGLDRRFALEMVQGSDVLVEYDKLIDRQLERAALTSIGGFATLFQGAARVLELMGGRGNEELLRPLYQAAEREMAGRLREGLSPEACGPAFPVAAAWLVLAGLEAGTDGVTSFSAGDLTVHTGGDGAGAMRRQAERLMAPYLADGFAFRGVLG